MYKSLQNRPLPNSCKTLQHHLKLIDFPACSSAPWHLGIEFTCSLQVLNQEIYCARGSQRALMTMCIL